MAAKSILRLQYIVDTLPELLKGMSEEAMSFKPSVDKWSKKEILGHLIDSATNNHHRIIRGQFELNPAISYDQNNWNTFSHYQDIDRLQIINFWTIYNKQLLEIINRIEPSHFERKVSIENNLMSLDELVVDYVDHLEHHLRQIIDYK